MKVKSMLAIGSMCAALAFGQPASGSGKTWSGVLVASGCNTSSMQSALVDGGRNNATAGRAANAANTGNAGAGAGSTTAGSDDRAGAAGQAGTQSGDMNRSTVGDRAVNNPQTGMADRDRGGDTQATAWEPGATGTDKWDKACFISPTTSSFMLLTRDGRQVRLDDASNQMLVERISSANRVSQKSKIFRVRVNGELTGDTLHVTDIRM